VSTNSTTRECDLKKKNQPGSLDNRLILFDQFY